MSVCFSVRKFLSQRRSKIFSGGGWRGEGGGVWWRLNNFFKATRCYGLVKCLTKLEIQPFFSIAILPYIALKRWNFPDNLDFKGKIVAKFLIKSHLDNMTIKKIRGKKFLLQEMVGGEVGLALEQLFKKCSFSQICLSFGQNKKKWKLGPEYGNPSITAAL